jgi:2-oxoisovalerate dehydrogenase E1 component
VIRERETEALGADLREIYRLALTVRALDERLWQLSRLGQVSFVLTGRGHEIAQIASAKALTVGQDSAWLYYRDLGVGIALGVTPYEFFLGALGRADDPHSGGRQLTSHLSSPRLRIGSVSSAIAAHIPQAVGAGYAARVRDENSVAMCWFGDGAASEGATHEAMNLAAVRKLPLVFVCENNGWAISVPQHLQMPIGSVADRGPAYAMPASSIDGTDAQAVLLAAREAVARARRGDGPSLIELRVPRITPHSSQDDDSYRSAGERDAAATADPLPRLRQELLEAKLLSEDEDDRMLAQIRAAVSADGDRALLAAAPEPGRARRWLFAGDANHEYLGGLESAASAGKRPVASRRPVAPAPSPGSTDPEVRMVEAIHDAIREEMLADPGVVVLGQDVALKGGVFKVTQGLLTEFGDLRVMDTPISEIAIAGAAIGAAMMGLRPVAEFQFSDYMHPAYDQIVNQAATMRWRSVGGWGVPVVFRAPIGAGVNGGIYHSQSVEALYCHIPGLKVVVPSNPRDAKGLLKSAIRDDDPVLFFEHKKLYRLQKEFIPPGEVVPLGKARLDREGTSLSIITYGIGVHHAREAAMVLQPEGIDVEILDLRTLVPFDKEAVARTVGKTSRVLLLHEANKTMGFGAELSAFIAEELFEELDAPITRVAASDCHLPYNSAEESAIIPSPAQVIEVARRLMAY